jgi:hypothetical protein
MHEKMDGIENIERALARAKVSETTKLENLLPFLATVGSAAPFVGLFGTVWGIMEAFTKIAEAGKADLATVAGPIGEALIATAIGAGGGDPGGGRVQLLQPAREGARLRDDDLRQRLPQHRQAPLLLGRDVRLMSKFIDDGFAGDGPVAGINVTPMVDVMLCLLIIFMVSTPLMGPRRRCRSPAERGSAARSRRSSSCCRRSRSTPRATCSSGRSGCRATR